MTLILLVLIYIKDFLIQFLTIVPSNIPVFKKKFKNFDEFLRFAGVNINNQVHIFFHMSTDIPQTANSI